MRPSPPPQSFPFLVNSLDILLGILRNERIWYALYTVCFVTLRTCFSTYWKAWRCPEEHFGRWIDFFEIRTYQKSNHPSTSFWSTVIWSIYTITFTFIPVYHSSLRVWVALCPGLYDILPLNLYSKNRISWYNSRHSFFKKIAFIENIFRFRSSRVSIHSMLL